MTKLDAEEQEILEAFDSGKLKKSRNLKRQKALHKTAAESAFKKDARINIRISSRDLRSLQARALREGIPYQTLVSSVLHKFVDGQFVEKTSSK